MKRKVLNLLLSVMLCVLCIPAMKVNATAGTAITIELNNDGSCKVASGTGFTCVTNGYKLGEKTGPLVTVDSGYNATIVTNGYVLYTGFYVDAQHNTSDVSGFNPILINGEFSANVTNQLVNVLENGNITGGEYSTYVINYGTISGGIFDTSVDNQHTITNGLFKKSVYHTQGTISGGIFLIEKLTNAKSLTLTNATIDGSSGAVSANIIAGTSVSITAPQTLSNLPFSKWNVTGGALQLANTTSVTFAMPAEDTAIEATYKESPTPTSPATASTAASSDWVPSYEIRFRDCNGKVISDQWIGEGQPAVIPSGYHYDEQELNWVYRNLTVSPISCKAAGYVVPDTADKN